MEVSIDENPMIMWQQNEYRYATQLLENHWGITKGTCDFVIFCTGLGNTQHIYIRCRIIMQLI
jgi:hypothetical protein